MRGGITNRLLVESLSRGCAGAAVLAALVLAAPAGAIVVSWDDAGGSASKLWSDFGNWSPDGDVASDDVNIGNFIAAIGDATLLDSSKAIASLTISNGASVTNSTDNGATTDFELIVNGLTTIGGAGSAFNVYGGVPDGLDTQGLTLNTGGTLNLNSTSAAGTAVVEIESGVLDLNAGGTIIGQGRIDFEGAAASVTTVFRNDGTLTANTSSGLIFQPPAAGTLRLNDGGNANRRFDWDGLVPVTAVINVNGNQTLDVDISTGTDAWSGDMNLFTGSTLDMRDPWSLDSGTIDANTAAFGLIIIGEDPNPGAGATITGASWSMSGGIVTVPDTWDTLILESNVNATGGNWNIDGTLQVDGSATFAAGTTITPLFGGSELRVNGTASIAQAIFDWDGFNVTTVNDGALLSINSPDIDSGLDGFDGQVFINGGTLNVPNGGWSLESSTINMDTSASDSDLSGSTITVNGASATINVTGAGNADADINANLVIDNTLTVNVAAGATLDLVSKTVNVTGTTWSGGAGSILRNGAATINAITTYDFAGGTVFLDDGNDTLNAQLNVNAAALSTNPLDGVDGTLTINNSGSLQVNLDGNATWQLDGVLNYNGDGVSGSIISGSSAVEFQPGSTLNVTGEGAIISRAIFEGTVNINSLGEDLELFGGDTTPGSTNQINGATINGPGQLAIDGGQALRGNGTINAPVRGDTTTSELIAVDGLLNVNGGIASMGVLGTSGNPAVLNITDPWNTAVTETVRLDGGRIQGSVITNDEPSGIEGEGLVIAQVINNTILDASSGGTLTFDHSSTAWDGAGGTGTLRASGAGSVLELVDNSAYLFDGTVTAQDGGVVLASGFELEFDPASTLNLTNNGTYRSTNATDIGGTVVVSASQGTLSISGTTVFENGSGTTLNANLLLDNTATNVQSGAAFAGAGRLINAPGRTLRLLNNADVGVLVENRGQFELGAGASIARGDVSDYVQTPAGSTGIDISGTGIGQFDRLFVNGNAQLAGEIDLALTGGYVPALLDSVTVINSSGLIGNFDTVVGISYAPGMGLAVTYTATNVNVTATLLGDTDLDGDVDDFDLLNAISNFTGSGATGNTWVGGDTDGDGDTDDFDLLNMISGFTGSLPASAPSVPEPGSVALIALGGWLLGRRRRSV